MWRTENQTQRMPGRMARDNSGRSQWRKLEEASVEQRSNRTVVMIGLACIQMESGTNFITQFAGKILDSIILLSYHYHLCWLAICPDSALLHLRRASYDPDNAQVLRALLCLPGGIMPVLIFCNHENYRRESPHHFIYGRAELSVLQQDKPPSLMHAVLCYTSWDVRVTPVTIISTLPRTSGPPRKL